jgi:hypothetical protein
VPVWGRPFLRGRRLIPSSLGGRRPTLSTSVTEIIGAFGIYAVLLAPRGHWGGRPDGCALQSVGVWVGDGAVPPSPVVAAGRPPYSPATPGPRAARTDEPKPPQLARVALQVIDPALTGDRAMTAAGAFDAQRSWSAAPLLHLG